MPSDTKTAGKGERHLFPPFRCILKEEFSARLYQSCSGHSILSKFSASLCPREPYPGVSPRKGLVFAYRGGTILVINAIRFRAVGESTWQSWKLNLGSGKFNNYQCITADRENLGRLASAVEFAVAGKEPDHSLEVMVQLSDNGGSTWIVQRRPGLVRYLRNGETMGAEEGGIAFAAALMDLDLESTSGAQVTVPINRLSLCSDEGQIVVRSPGSDYTQAAAFRRAVAKKIKDIAMAAARALSLPQLQNPKVLARLAQRLEPVYAQYREIERLAKDAPTTEAPQIRDEELVTQQRLGQEIELIEEIRVHATPLLAPGAPSLKALRDALAKVEADIAQMTAELGISESEVTAPARDYGKAIDALCRLEAHGKLLKASQGARKFCEQKIEAPFKAYLEALEREFARDGKVIQQLDGCLGQITARIDHFHQELQGGQVQGYPQGPGVKTWFDRFKAKSHEDDRQESASAEIPSELELARQAVSYALGKVRDIAGGLAQAQGHQESALQALDQAHEELVRGLGRLRDHWLTQAREVGLPEDLNLGKLLKVVASQGQLTAWIERREDLKERVHRHTDRLTRIERLVIDWRRVTGSQKQSDLENPGILLQEARDIIRYHEAKRKKFDQLTALAASSKASLAVRSMLKERKAKLLGYWQKVFTEESVPALDISFSELSELFKASGYIRALAIVHGESQGATSAKVFDARTQGSALTLYVCEETALDSKVRLSLLSELEAAQGTELRILLMADEAAAQALAPLGIGMSVLLPKAAPSESKIPSRSPEVPRPTPTTRPPMRPSPSRDTTSANPDALLADRAQRALNILNGRVR